MKNDWAFKSGLGIDFISREHDMIFTCINIYGPYSGRNEYWDHTLSNPLIQNGRVIVANDFNFTLGAYEICGWDVHLDPLSDHLLDLLERETFMDLLATKLSSTW
jgi:hypothetical protein